MKCMVDVLIYKICRSFLLIVPYFSLFYYKRKSQFGKFFHVLHNCNMFFVKKVALIIFDSELYVYMLYVSSGIVSYKLIVT